MSARFRYDADLMRWNGGAASVAQWNGGAANAAVLPATLPASAARRTARDEGTHVEWPAGMSDARQRSAALAEAAVDRALLTRVAARDAAAFRDLAARHLGAVLSHTRRMLRDDAEAEDVSQETLLRLWQQAPGLELGDHGLRPWLRRVAANLCIDRIRAGKRFDVTDEVPEQEEPPTQLTGLLQQDLAARVDAALHALPERQRIALTLFQYEGLSQVEIGEKLGVSDEAVESLLSRARRALRKMLDEDWRRLASDA